jgi:hypothetical protein
LIFHTLLGQGATVLHFFSPLFAGLRHKKRQVSTEYRGKFLLSLQLTVSGAFGTTFQHQKRVLANII